MMVRRTSAVAIGAFLIAASGLAQRVPDVRLDTANPTAFTGASLRPLISVAGSNVYVVWEDNRVNGESDYGIYFNRSLDGGRTWLAADVRLDAGAPFVSSYDPVISSFGSHVFVAWTDSHVVGTSAISFTRSLDSGTSWSPNVHLDPGGNHVAHPRLANDGDVVYAVWSEVPSGSDSVQYTVSPMAGAPGTWTLPISISGPMSYVLGLELACAGPNVYVAWYSLVSGPVSHIDIFFNRTTTGASGGGFFQTPITLDTQPPAAPAGASVYPKIACSGSEVYVVWSDGRNHQWFDQDVYFQKSVDAGLTFLASDVQLNEETGIPGESTHDPAIALGIGSPTRVYVAWWKHDSGAGTFAINFKASQDGGTTWPAAETRLDTPPSQGSLVDLDAMGSSVAAVWTNDYGTGSYQVFSRASFDGGLSWDLREVKLNTGGSVRALFPRVAMETPTKLHAVWYDWRPPPPGEAWGNSDIYTNVWEPGLTVAHVAGASTFSLDVTMDPFLPYVGAASFDYTPGLELTNRRTIPLNYDALAMISIDPAYASIFSAFTGNLDAMGHASATIYYPPGVSSGSTFYVAFVTLDPVVLDGVRTVTRGVAVTVP